MEKIHVLIVEDDPEMAEELKNELLELQYRVTAANNLTEAIGQFHLSQPDIVLIDIVLNGEKGGIKLAQHIYQDQSKRVPVLFLTNMQDRETFEQARRTVPCGYLLKPYNPMELVYAIELALEQFYSPDQADTKREEVKCLFVKKRDRMVKLQFEDVEYIQVEGRYCQLHTAKENYLIQYSLKELQELLPASSFVRIHRTYVVQVDSIRSLSPQDSTVEMKGGKLLPLSRRYLQAIKQNYKILV
ncbi:response regulator transcription factor [bacterium SCSIO 12741]|nr:response regulator transcription factor [bacterium SCSIO 12741]